MTLSPFSWRLDQVVYLRILQNWNYDFGFLWFLVMILPWYNQNYYNFLQGTCNILVFQMDALKTETNFLPPFAIGGCCQAPALKTATDCKIGWSQSSISLFVIEGGQLDNYMQYFVTIQQLIVIKKIVIAICFKSVAVKYTEIHINWIIRSPGSVNSDVVSAVLPQTVWQSCFYIKI